MSAQNPANFTEWLQNAPIGPVVSGANGQAWAKATGTIVDTYVGYLRDGIKARYPDNAPVDALPHQGNDCQLIQGSNESVSSFRARLKDKWGQWSRAGTACGVLEQLAYYTQSVNATWLQQNGLQIRLASMPTPGIDPTPLVTTTNAPATPAILTSTAPPYRQIPSGTPWVFLDGNTDLCNRFSIRFGSWPFSSLTQVFFNNSDVATATWPVRFAGNYSTIYGMPSAQVILSVDGTATNSTTVTMRASAPWTGSVWVIGFAAGVDPFNVFSFASLGQLQRIISTFRPNAICTGVYAIGGGRVLGDGRALGDGGVLGGTVIQILGQF